MLQENPERPTILVPSWKLSWSLSTSNLLLFLGYFLSSQRDDQKITQEEKKSKKLRKAPWPRFAVNLASEFAVGESKVVPASMADGSIDRFFHCHDATLKVFRSEKEAMPENFLWTQVPGRRHERKLPRWSWIPPDPFVHAAELVFFFPKVRKFASSMSWLGFTRFSVSWWSFGEIITLYGDYLSTIISTWRENVIEFRICIWWS